MPEKSRYAKGKLRIDPVTPEDMPLFMELMEELAVALGARGWFVNPEENLRQALFSEPPRMEAIIVRYAGEPAGFATWYETYEVLSGKLVMWFDYFFTRPEYRKQPITPAMLIYILMLARDRDYIYVEGTVQEWNDEALQLYTSLKADNVPHHLFRLDLSKRKDLTDRVSTLAKQPDLEA